MIKINLLPKEARKRVGLTEQILIILFVLIATFSGIGVYWSYLNNVIEEKQEHIVQIKNKLQELQRVIDEIEQFEKRMAALKEKLAVIETLKIEQKMPVYFLNEFYLTLEEDLWLKTFNQTGSFASANSKVDITGTALSQPVVADYARRLNESSYFNNIDIKYVRKRQAGSQEVRDFQITAGLTVEDGLMADLPEDMRPKEEAPEEEEAPKKGSK